MGPACWHESEPPNGKAGPGSGDLETGVGTVGKQPQDQGKRLEMNALRYC